MEFRLCFYCSLLVFLNIIIFVHSFEIPFHAEFTRMKDALENIFTPSSPSNCIEGEQAVKLNNWLVREHNEYRKRHGIPPLEPDTNLMNGSIEWSKKLTSKGRMKHSSANGHYGENLFWTSRPGPSIPHQSTYDPVKSWYDEIQMYRGGFSKDTGHYTQVVWKNSRRVGCGICGNSRGTFVTCRYFPPGNYEGQFAENVPPPRSNHG
ncbi:Golgi-associated plant pathogenesis-related protein 1-like [Planococcus citri]|uniref:Golgi-associated plant pathogenesis-related protein 1-like n=1 Tax=Planococcus citri TaxID=170843 RepID=UPI0031F9AAFD